MRHDSLHAEPRGSAQVKSPLVTPSEMVSVRMPIQASSTKGRSVAGEDADPGLVEFPGHDPEPIRSQSLAPALDPEAPTPEFTPWEELGDDGFKSFPRREVDCSKIPERPQFGFGGVSEGLDEQLVLGGEVVVDEARRDVEESSNIGDAGGGQPSFAQDFAGRLEDLLPTSCDRCAVPLGDVVGGLVGGVHAPSLTN